MKKIIATLLCLNWFVALAAPPVIFGPNSSVQALTTRGLLVGNQLQQTGNYVVNPSAFRDATTGVSTGTLTVGRSTNLPISTERVAKFTISGTALGGNAAIWTINPLSEGLKGGQCEARWRYRGANASTVFEIRQGALSISAPVIARLPATVDATNVTQGSLPFPCGDLSVATWFAVTGTSISPAMELAEIDIGAVKAFGDAANITAWQSYTPTFTGFGTPTGVSFFRRRIGDTAEFSGTFTGGTSTVTEARISLGSASETLSIGTTLGTNVVVGYGALSVATNTQSLVIASSGETYLKFGQQSSGTGGSSPSNANVFLSNGQTYSFFARVPISQWSSVNAAVTPGSQNVWGSRFWNGNQTGVSRNSNAWSTFTGSTYQSNFTNLGSASACTNPADLCVSLTNAPAQQYSASITATFFAETGTTCGYALSTTNSAAGIFATFENRGDTATNSSYSSTISGVFNVPSVQNLEVYVLGNRISGTGVCEVTGSSSSRSIAFSVVPVSRGPSNVFIQSPVRAAGTGVAPLSNEVDFRNKVNLGSNQTATLGSNIPTASFTLTTGRYKIRAKCAGVSNGASTYAEAFVGSGLNTCAAPINESRWSTGGGAGGATFFSSDVTTQTVSGSASFTACCRQDGTAGQWSTDSYIEAFTGADR